LTREALPPPPNVQGTPAEYDERTFARTWPERRETYAAPTLPEPVQRAVEVEANVRTLPRNVRTLAALAYSRGFSVRITHAIGYDSNSDGSQATQDVMEPTGEMTPGGKKSAPRPAMHKVGEELLPPVDSIRIVVIAPGNKRFVGHWKNNGWDFGLILDGRTLVRNVNWSQLKEAVDAEGGQDVRAQGRQGELSLEGYEGESV
jgi:hypothetical protein